MTRGKDATTSSTRTFTPKEAKPAPAKTPAPKKPKQNNGRALKIIVVLLILFSAFMVYQYHSAKTKLQSNSPAKVSQQTASTLSKVKKLIIVPTNETPTIITVKDASKLSSEAFYANAKNGDITLVFAKNKKAILYRPSQNIIVNVADVTVTGAKQ